MVYSVDSRMKPPSLTPPHVAKVRTNRLSEAPSSATFKWERERRDSEVAIHKLVRPDDLSVVFQPIVDMKTGAIFAHESLVRCRVKEIADPPTLFREAVRVNCSGRLGRMIREIAVPWCAGIPVFVNVHPSELNEPWLVRPDDPIFQHDTDVYVEITESTPLTHFDRCIDVIKELRVRGGVHMVIDDLGAGYSNLRRIADLEPKVVKLDRDLIMGLDRSARQRALVKGVVRLCEDLGATVVAEGIETEDEAMASMETGAHYGQGYLFAKPAFPIPGVYLPPFMQKARTSLEKPAVTVSASDSASRRGRTGRT